MRAELRGGRSGRAWRGVGDPRASGARRGRGAAHPPGRAAAPRRGGGARRPRPRPTRSARAGPGSARVGRRRTLLAMLAPALLVVLAAGEHAAAPPPAGLIPLTRSELRRLLLHHLIEPARRPADPEAWSRWRRRHQYRARASHYRRQAACLP